MPFDEYLVKPVSADDVRETVEELLRRGELDEELREYMSLSSTLAALEAEGDTDDEAVSELKAEVDARREDAEATLEEMDFEQAFREV
jgi:DNA-binding response OmpR family regulator